MTSPNGVTWTTVVPPVKSSWRGLTFGNGKFVSVAASASSASNAVMTSTDGSTWTTQTGAVNNSWYSVVYGNGLFVAVSITGTNNRVMTSPDGITWTSRTSAADNQWYDVTFGNGTFVAVAQTGTGNRVMTSTNGINWSTETSAADINWRGVAFGNYTFVAVANSGAGNRVMNKSNLSPQQSLTVTNNNTASAASSTPTLCGGNTLTNITHTTTGATGIGTATNLPAGVTAAWAANTITISGTPEASGTFNYSIPLTGGCGTVEATGTITVNPVSVGGTVSGDASICPGTNSTTLTLAGNTGAVTKWQSATSSDFSTGLTDISNTTTSLIATNLTVTTYYRAVIGSGVCSTANSSTGTITVDGNEIYHNYHTFAIESGIFIKNSNLSAVEDSCKNASKSSNPKVSFKYE
jgi:hypothetical protein